MARTRYVSAITKSRATILHIAILNELLTGSDHYSLTITWETVLGWEQIWAAVFRGRSKRLSQSLSHLFYVCSQGQRLRQEPSHPGSGFAAGHSDGL